MKLVIKLGTPYKAHFDDEYFETDEQWEEETANLDTARSRLGKEFRIYDIEERSNKIVAWVY